MKEQGKGQRSPEQKPKTPENARLDAQGTISPRFPASQPAQQPHGVDVNRPALHPPKEGVNGEHLQRGQKGREAPALSDEERRRRKSEYRTTYAERNTEWIQARSRLRRRCKNVETYKRYTQELDSKPYYKDGVRNAFTADELEQRRKMDRFIDRFREAVGINEGFMRLLFEEPTIGDTIDEIETRALQEYLRPKGEEADVVKRATRKVIQVFPPPPKK